MTKATVYTVTGTLKIVERLKNSVNGNPRYSLIIISDDQELYINSLVTGVDSSHGYGITNFEDKKVTVDYKIIRSKNTLVDIKLV